jgi:hypothetical protein
MVACPRCGSQDAVQKVSSIVSGGTYETTYEMPAQGQLGGHTVYGTVQQRGMAQTALAQKLNLDPSDKYWSQFADSYSKQAEKAFKESQPPPMVGFWPRALLVVGFVIVLSGAFFIPLAFVGLGIVWLSVRITPVERKEWDAKLASTKEQAKQKVPQLRNKALTRWNELYYCHRDDLVFLPNEGLSAPSSDIMRMLMWD